MSSRIDARRKELQRKMREADRAVCRNSAQLHKAVEAWADAAHKDGLYALLAALGTCFARLVQRTPVDTGRARAGWHIEPEKNDWKPAPGDYKAEIAAVIERETRKLDLDLTKADVVWVMNNVEYIGGLEAGTSRQSAGFFALFLQELSSQLEAAAARSRRGYA